MEEASAGVRGLMDRGSHPLSFGSTVIFESGVIMPMPQLKANSPACRGVKVISVVLRVGEEFPDAKPRRDEKRPQPAASLPSIHH